MDPVEHDLAALSTCTTCQFKEDFSNYWTAVLYFRARNGTFKRVPQIAQAGMEGTNGGMVVYYMSDALFSRTQTTKVTAFQPGFRMLVGDANYRTREEAQRFRQLTYICMESQMSRTPETVEFPKGPCRLGIMANHRFPTCWDGVNLDSVNHQDHVAYPESGTFENGGPCPASHPVRIPQLMLETVWETSSFNDPNDWPEDGSQPFVWSSGDPTGFSNHADYLFGWEGDSLQQAMDAGTYVSAPMLTSQSIAEQNRCTVGEIVSEEIDGWLTELPGGNPIL